MFPYVFNSIQLINCNAPEISVYFAASKLKIAILDFEGDQSKPMMPHAFSVDCYVLFHICQM